MSFIEEYKDNLYIKKNNILYNTEIYNHEILFTHPKDLFNLYKKKKSIIIDSSSSSDDEFNYVYDDYNYDGDNYCKGGKKESKKSYKSKVLVKRSKLTILPTFINILKGRIIYTNQTKLELEEIEPQDKKDVILGTILDLKNMKDSIKNKNDLMKYIKTYNIIPLMFNFNHKNIIYKNKKKTFFNDSSNLIFVTFKINDKYKYYTEVINKSPYEKLKNVSSVLNEKNYIISHYIYENFYMFFNTKKHNFEIHNCFAIDKNHTLVEQNLTSFQLINLSEKIFLDDFIEILNDCKKHLTVFS